MEEKDHHFSVDLPEHFPEWPSHHPLATIEQVELGRWLFYDRRLSRDGTRSCGICHEQAKAFSDGLSLSLGIDNTVLSLNSPSLANIAWRSELTWNHQFSSVEEQILLPLFAVDPVEMGMTEELLLERIREYQPYIDLFEQAFPDEVQSITIENTIHALSSFTRSIVSTQSKYDRWRMGDEELTEEEEEGLRLFHSEELKCVLCHGGVFFDHPQFEEESIRHGYVNTGLYNIDGEGAYPISAQGLIAQTGNPSDMGRFRVPTLRNLRQTYPWMHDGSEISLRNIILNYAAGGRVLESGSNQGDGRNNPYKSEYISGFTISDAEIDALISFLYSLEDERLLEVDHLATPFCVEREGEVINEPCEANFEVE